MSPSSAPPSSIASSGDAAGDGALTQELKTLARELGFARAGVARAEKLEEEGKRLREWLAAGRHASMGWMESTAEVRCDPRVPQMVEHASSVMVLATPYGRGRALDGPAGGRIAAYAVGRDYHRVLGKRLRRLERVLRSRGFAARASVDSKPVFERAWAQRAGIGFVGKNCCLIVPGIGSQVFLSCVVTTAKLVADKPMAGRCGRCTLCLTQCPTSAFVSPRQLDARRCVSYLTIEHRGSVPEHLREGIGGWVFGCDECQDVCPYNHSRHQEEGDGAFAPGERWDVELGALLEMTDAEFDDWSRGSPVRRTGLAGLARNAALVLGNRGGRTHLRVLNRAAENHPHESVREASRWAQRQIRNRLLPRIEREP